MQTGIGTPLSRVDGPLKVTGRARYAADHPANGLLYGVAVSSAVAKGRIASIDTKAASAVPGVVEVITHENRPAVSLRSRSYRDAIAPGGVPFRPLYDDKIHFSGQPLALVVAETFEAARHAATLVAIEYKSAPHNTDLRNALDERFLPRAQRSEAPPDRGDAPAAYQDAPVRVTGEYHLAIEHHHPMELHGTTVIWDGDGRITVYDKNQGSQNIQGYLASALRMRKQDVRVRNPFVGGAFGSALRPQYQVFLAVLAAKKLERSVRVSMTRQQMFTHMHRTECLQMVSLGSGNDGRLASILTTATTATSRFEDYAETVLDWCGTAYACKNAAFDYAIAKVDIPTPGPMRGPGAATGMNLFEIAMDELAYAADVDPLELRIRNYTETNALNGKPYTSKALLPAYREGAARFGWDRRTQPPRSMKDGSELIGWGVATGIWEAMMMETSARATLGANGHLDVASATSDIGPGTYTMMTQVAAETLSLPVDRITARLGDSDLPKAPVQGGSAGAASVGAAVHLACRSIAEKLLKAAGKVDGKPLGGAKLEQVAFVDGAVRLKADPSRAVGYGEIMRAAGLASLEGNGTAKAASDDKARNAHSANFAEVRVDEELGVVRVTRVVCAVAAGRIINPKTARSQIIGGVVMGLGMALREESVMDHRHGRFMTRTLADYHVPVHADVPEIDVIFIDEPDAEVSPLGVKGVGEIGAVGSAAAIANAVFHATGKRVRRLPITIDKLLD